MFFNIFFFPNLLFFLEWGLGLIGHPLVFNGYRFVQRYQFSFHQNHICYLYFQDGNCVFGSVICWCFLVEILSYNVMLKKCFLLTETYCSWQFQNTSVIFAELCVIHNQTLDEHYKTQYGITRHLKLCKWLLSIQFCDITCL